MSSASADGGGGACVAEVDCCSWCVGIGDVAVTELTPKVPTPAGDLTVVEECAGVVVSGGDGGGSVPVW